MHERLCSQFDLFWEDSLIVCHHPPSHMHTYTPHKLLSAHFLLTSPTPPTLLGQYIILDTSKRKRMKDA